MAIFIPSIEQINKFKVAPTEGERTLLAFLESALDDSYEVYFNPYMNEDRPDVVIMRKGQGVMIIEVKDWDLNLYELDEKKHWRLKSDSKAFPLSPIQQVLKYKDNLFELHIENLLEMKIKDIRNFNIVSCAVYFHNASSKQVNDLLVTPYKNQEKYQTFLKYNVDLLGHDNLNEKDFFEVLKRRFLISERPSFLFQDELYNSIKRFLNPPIHMKEEGVDFAYSPKQREIIFGFDKTEKKEHRIKGVVGSGKTTVMAARAVQAYKRLSQNNPDVRILILTYNITLKNFIHDKISKVKEDFPWSAFVISNYHLFINSQLNNLGIPIVASDEMEFESKYYSNKALFEANKSQLQLFDAIYIDEIQDYKRPWMDIIKDYFLTDGGEYVLFGDVKQNIYLNPTTERDVRTNIQGKPIELPNCFRSDYKIKDLAIEFQKNVFRQKYEIDDFNDSKNQTEIQYERNQQGYVNYMFLEDTNVVSSLYTIIHENMLNEENKSISPNDITVLGYTIRQLQRFEAYYRYLSGEHVKTMFETYEIMYLTGLRKSSANGIPQWILDGLILIKRDNDRKRDKGFNQLAHLLTVYDLYKEYPDQFKQKLSFYCTQYKTSLQEFEKYMNNCGEEFKLFRSTVFRSNREYDIIRKNKKIHFWMNCGTIKISTINSFKGWESELVFLILEPRYEQQNDFNEAFDELLYTAITRCRSNLVIINYGNLEYDAAIRSLVETVNS